MHLISDKKNKMDNRLYAAHDPNEVIRRIAIDHGSLQYKKFRRKDNDLF